MMLVRAIYRKLSFAGHEGEMCGTHVFSAVLVYMAVTTAVTIWSRLLLVRRDALAKAV